jgi:nicotinic acid mononucleotide adenylyltransferase
MIKIEGLSKRQMKIADLLWACSTIEETEELVEQIGKEADVVRELMLLAGIDELVEVQTDFSKIQTLLKNIG